MRLPLLFFWQKSPRQASARVSAVFVWLFSVFLLSSCGFTPLYGTSGGNLGPINVAQIDTRIGYFLHEKLEAHSVLERGTTSPRTLNVVLRKEHKDTNLRSDGFRTRIQIVVFAHYELIGASGKIEGDVSTTIGYDGGADAGSEIALSLDAEERAANQLADKIWVDLLNKTRQ
ncbi:MAG: hypothetical protein FD163_427 [Hyphomonadaceae bacterium]|nr:MAG: hypothetical protein FD163_427 [Hyphomonadaceae bacterium]